jgi:hypothetical protein
MIQDVTISFPFFANKDIRQVQRKKRTGLPQQLLVLRFEHGFYECIAMKSRVPRIKAGNKFNLLKWHLHRFYDFEEISEERAVQLILQHG